MRTRTASLGTALFFGVAPGMVAGVVPWLLTRWQTGYRLPPALRGAGIVLTTIATVLLAQAFVRFVVEGAGTPSPTAPTERLVVGGLYRYVRNPMYLAVVAAIVGQAMVLGRAVLGGWAVLVTFAVVAFVRLYEEPVLLRRFGASYEEYRSSVPAWWPRRPSADSEDAP